MPEIAMRRHHLIEESKAELDVAYEEVKRAEQKIMSLEYEYNDRAAAFEPMNGESTENKLRELMQEKSAAQERLDIESLYRLQSTAIERFSIVSAAFSIVASVDDDKMVVDLIRKLLFDKDAIGPVKIEIDTLIRDFSRGLHGYTRKESSSENDRLVRQSWVRIEELLRGFGRNI
jgi:hypothetical protein